MHDEIGDKGISGWHNDVLQIYFESGLIGLLSFIILLFTTFKVTIKQVRNRNNDAELRQVSASILLVISVLTLSIVTGGFITSVVISIVFILLISILSRIEIANMKV